MRVFGDELRISKDSLYLRGNDGEEMLIPITDSFHSKMKWLLGSTQDALLDYSDRYYEVFFGPYIMHSITGYVIQIIDKANRSVITRRYPFGIIHLDDIKKDLRRVYHG